MWQPLLHQALDSQYCITIEHIALDYILVVPGRLGSYWYIKTYTLFVLARGNLFDQIFLKSILSVKQAQVIFIHHLHQTSSDIILKISDQQQKIAQLTISLFCESLDHCLPRVCSVLLLQRYALLFFSTTRRTPTLMITQYWVNQTYILFLPHHSATAAKL